MLYKVQELKTKGYTEILKFCKWLLENKSLRPFILYTDESQLQHNGLINYNNIGFWTEKNPYQAASTSTQNCKCLVWNY